MQVGMALTPNSLARRKPGVQIPSPPPITALVTGLAGRSRRAGAVPDPAAGQQTGSNRERKRPPLFDRGHDDVVKRGQDFLTFRLRVGPKPSNWTRPAPILAAQERHRFHLAAVP